MNVEHLTSDNVIASPVVIYNGMVRTNSNIVPIDETAISIEKNYIVEKKESQFLTCGAYLLSLAVFGIAGVFSRYGLKLLSEMKVTIRHKETSITNDRSFLYPDLLANMVGSFLMGWLGVVFKPDISSVSDQLAVGLSTGFLGCLTTFSGWNQSMLNLSVQGLWGYSVLCLIIGFVLVGFAIVLGVWTANLFKHSISSFKISETLCSTKLNKSRCLVMFPSVLLVTLAVLWIVFAAVGAKSFKEGRSEAKLCLAGLVGPFGVWLRWYLAHLNGRGLGRNRTLKWMPFGTLAANVLACCVMAAMATLKETVNTREVATVVTAIQLGLLGSLSTVSTFVSELHGMGRSCHTLRMVCYAAATVVPSFGLGTLIYSLPTWIKHKN